MYVCYTSHKAVQQSNFLKCDLYRWFGQIKFWNSSSYVDNKNLFFHVAHELMWRQSFRTTLHTYFPDP